LLCEGAVVEVFPQLAVGPEIDLHCGFLAGFVHEETNSRDHEPISTACMFAAHSAGKVPPSGLAALYEGQRVAGSQVDRKRAAGRYA
jgi:hypothetical protein